MACSYRCRNYKYFGLQGWGRCYCGNKLETGTQCHDVGRPWWRWWSWYWPWGPRDCNKGNVHRSPSNRGSRVGIGILGMVVIEQKYIKHQRSSCGWRSRLEIL